MVILMEVHSPGVHGKGVTPESRSLEAFSLDDIAFCQVHVMRLDEI